MRRVNGKDATLPFGPGRWGGAREGSGPKLRDDSGVSHMRRELLERPLPVHVTVKLAGGLPSLRHRRIYGVLRGVFGASQHRAGTWGQGFRLVHYSVQSNHLHLMVEASDSVSLARGMQGLLVRMARRLNKLWERKGRVVADRFHSRALRTPREVRNALKYVLKNHERHGVWFRGVDPFSSGASFDGWRGVAGPSARSRLPDPVVRARTWLLAKGWRRCRLLPAPLAQSRS